MWNPRVLLMGTGWVWRGLSGFLPRLMRPTRGSFVVGSGQSLELLLLILERLMRLLRFSGKYMELELQDLCLCCKLVYGSSLLPMVKVPRDSSLRLISVSLFFSLVLCDESVTQSDR